MPERLRAPGASYAIRDLHFHGVTFAVRYEVRTTSALRVTLEYESPEPIGIEVRRLCGQPIVSVTERQQQGKVVFESENRCVLTVRLAT